jgi:putative acetyltransferase
MNETFGPSSGFAASHETSGGFLAMNREDIVIEPIQDSEEWSASEIIRRNLQVYEEAGSVIASTFRRLESFHAVYTSEGARYLVAKDQVREGLCIGGVGVGPLQGLPHGEGVGEIRDLVLEESYRGRGIGTRLLKRALEEARKFGYQRLYLETTPQMHNARQLFLRFGFRPVTSGSSGKVDQIERLPCYFVLEDLGRS